MVLWIARDHVARFRRTRFLVWYRDADARHVVALAPRLHFGNLRSAVLLECHFRFACVRSRLAASCALNCVNRAIERIVRQTP
jgi:hypothetical protein